MWYKILVLSCAAACTVYHLLSLVWGSTGVVARESLEDYRKQLTDNILILEDHAIELQTMAERLDSDREVLKVQGHDSGLLLANEERIRLSPRSDDSNPLSPGGVITRSNPPVIDIGLLRFLAILVGFVVAGVLFTNQKSIDLSLLKRRRLAQGIRVHTASLE